MSVLIERGKPRPLRILVFCVHPGTLLNYSVLLNERGFFHLSLCDTTQQVAHALGRGGYFDLLIHDDFCFDSNDRDFVLQFARNLNVDSLLFVGDMALAQRREAFNWAREHGVPLFHFLPQPLCASELEKVLTLFRQRGCPVQQKSNARQVAIEHSNNRGICLE